MDLSSRLSPPPQKSKNPPNTNRILNGSYPITSGRNGLSTYPAVSGRNKRRSIGYIVYRHLGIYVINYNTRARIEEKKRTAILCRYSRAKRRTCSRDRILSVLRTYLYIQGDPLSTLKAHIISSFAMLQLFISDFLKLKNHIL